jgi:hypothetical protein
VETAVWLTTSPSRIEHMVPRKCSFDGCDKPFLAKGYCSAHYCLKYSPATGDFALQLARQAVGALVMRLNVTKSDL